MRAGDDVGADQFADACGGFGSGVHGGFHAADDALYEDGEKRAADGDLFDYFNAGSLRHCVAGFHAGDVASGFDHSD
jgi:hypothetical protein